MKRFIEENYGLTVTGISPLSPSFYGEVYRVDTPGRAFFAKLDRWKQHSAEFRESLGIVAGLREYGIDFVPGLIRGKSGESCFSFDGGVFALFEFAEGEHTEDVPAEMLFERLGTVYSRVPVAQKTSAELFAPIMYERVLRLRTRLKACKCLRFDELLEARAALLADRAAKLELFMERCRRKAWRTVMTHGDPGGNCIVGSGGVTLMDWDTAMPSVPERDAWAHICREDAVRHIEEGLARGGYEYRLDGDALGFFANSWFFEYIGNYLQCAADAPERSDEMAELLDEYFGCWIFDVLARADGMI